MTTKIEWTDHTANPIIGCSKVSPGCAHCYASDLAASMVRRRLPIADRYREVLDPTGKRWSGRTVVADAATLARMKVPRRKRVQGFEGTDHPLGWRPARVFLGSMTDVFHDTLDTGRIVPVMRWMASFGGASGPIWQIVTKRPHRAREILPELWEGYRPNEWPRIHLLTSTEDQETADQRVPEVLACRPWVEIVGLSMEPLLGPVTLAPAWLAGLGWVIVGGESGDDARPCALGWIEKIVGQVKAAGVPCFVKQDYGPRPGQQGRIPDHLWMKEWPWREIQRKGEQPSSGTESG